MPWTTSKIMKAAYIKQIAKNRKELEQKSAEVRRSETAQFLREKHKFLNAG
ncbi:hypothetical protein GN109_05715 [Collimonas pratensis]|uniref:hypothetical protein n=1 Tax=Collimonas pratensis TaxID=279113 RepID=UPI00143CED9E|nr:hypothetical protein [Collimonas pratensis]NKI68911.1 hypothetical protein [Collimonas pratensis]